MIERKYRLVIGRNEPVILAGFDIDTQFPAKIDTGAYRSAVHCIDMKVSTKNGVKVLSGEILGNHPCGFGKSFKFETADFKQVRVANSFGKQEDRYEIKIRLKVGPLVFTTSTTLADRSQKLFPILLGRKALTDRFIVDVTHANIDRLALKHKYGVSLPDDEEDFINENEE